MNETSNETGLEDPTLGDGASSDTAEPTAASRLLEQPVWNLVRPAVESCGFKLFDLETPRGPNGALRVYVWRGPGQPGILLDDCATVSRKLDEVAELLEVIPWSFVLEVSSPGICRSLTRPEHFQDAMGERIKLVTRTSYMGRSTFYGTVLSSDGVKVVIQDKAKAPGKKGKGVPVDAPPVEIALSLIRRAQIDFDFSQSRSSATDQVAMELVAEDLP